MFGLWYCANFLSPMSQSAVVFITHALCIPVLTSYSNINFRVSGSRNGEMRKMKNKKNETKKFIRPQRAMGYKLLAVQVINILNMIVLFYEQKSHKRPAIYGTLYYFSGNIIRAKRYYRYVVVNLWHCNLPNKDKWMDGWNIF